MREMVLHHASVTSPDRRTAVDWLKDVATGMAQLIDKEVALASLRTHRPLEEIGCVSGYSLRDAYQWLRKDKERDLYVFLMGLSTKCPLLSEVASAAKDRFLACETTKLLPDDGEPLVLCAIQNWISVGFPSVPVWDNDYLTVSFDELLPDGKISETSETIDNLTRSIHAHSIYKRHHAVFLQSRNPAELWALKAKTFPHLFFGPDVQLPSEFSWSIVGRLAELDRSGAEWHNVGGPIPPWTCKVTPESDKVKNNKKLLDARRFMSRRGKRELFEWHARVGSGVRIHLRFDPASQEIEIGYIGLHLPL